MKKLILTLAIFTSVQIAFTQQVSKQTLDSLKQIKKEQALTIKKLKAEQKAERDSLQFVKLNATIQKQRATIQKLNK
jgi:hypothetical protein